MDTVDLIGLGDLTPRDPLVLPTHSVPELLTSSGGLNCCPYCGQLGPGWRTEDLRRGRRDGTGYVEYHCYEAKVLD